MGKRPNPPEADEKAPVTNTQPTKRTKLNPPGDSPTPNATMEFCFFNVGQGECTLIKLPNQQWMLIDFGSKAGWSKKSGGFGDEVKKEIIARVPGKRFEYVILTHPDADHYNKLGFLLSERFTINHLYFSSMKEEQEQERETTIGNPLAAYIAGNGVGRVGETIFTSQKADYLHFVSINAIPNGQNYIRSFSKIDEYQTSAYNREMKAEGYLVASSRTSPQEQNATWEIFIMAGNVKSPLKNEPIAKNTCSIVTLFKLNNGQQHILLRGDATDYTDDFLLRKYGAFFNGNIMDLGNIAHHGSDIHCNKADYIGYLAPKSSIVSCQPNGMMYAHPRMNVEIRYLDARPTNNPNIINIDGWDKNNAFISEDQSDKTQPKKPYWETILNTWKTNNIAYKEVRNKSNQGENGEKGKVCYFMSKPPDNPLIAVTIKVCNNGDYCERVSSLGDLMGTYNANARDTFYIDRVFTIYAPPQSTSTNNVKS